MFKGPGVFMGYSHSCEDLNKNNLIKNTLSTGDMGYYDSEGFYYITGRKKRISKLFGIRINLDELERKIKYKSYDVACIEKKQKILIFYEKNYNKKNLEKVVFNLTNVNKNGFTLKKN